MPIQPVTSRSSYALLDQPQEALQTSRSDFELPDLDIRDLNYNLIQSGIIHASVPMQVGNYVFPGKYEKAHVVVKPDTMGWLTLYMGRNSRNEAVITKAFIEISPSIKVTNPSSAYEPPGCMNRIRDWFSDVIIHGIEISPEGKVLFQGKIKKGCSKEDIKTAFKPEMFPVIDLKLETLKKKKINLQKIGLPELIAQFKNMLGEIKCSAKLRTDVPVLSVPQHGFSIKTQKKDAELFVHLKASLTSDGELKLKTDQDLKSAVEFLDTQAILEGELRVSKLNHLKPELEGQASANMPVCETQLWVDYKDQSEIPLSLGQDGNYIHARAQLQPGKPALISTHGWIDTHVAELDPVRVGAFKTKFQGAHFHVDGSGDIQGKRKLAQGNIHAVVSHPQLNWRGLDGTVKGQAGVSIQANDLMHGTINYVLDSDRLRPFRRELSYAFFPNKRLALSPHNTGVSEFLDPVDQFVWDSKNIVDPKSLPVGELGSIAWRERLEKITGAPIRKHNRLTLLKDGVTSFPKRLELIQNAKRSICVQSLIFKDDDSGMATAKELVKAHQRGVQVRVIIDSFANLDSVKELVRGNKVYGYLRSHGVRLELYSNMAVRGLRDILSVVEDHRSFQGLKSLKDFVNPAQTLSTIHMLAKVAHGTLGLGLKESDQKKVHEGLRMILGDTDRAQVLIERLTMVSPEQPLQFSEMVEILNLTMGLNHRWHEKYLVVDGEKAIVGGMNIADEYMKGGSPEVIKVIGRQRPAWRDTDLLIEGEGALDVEKCFAKNWKLVNGEDLSLEPMPVFDPTWNEEIQIVQSTPQRGPSHTITNSKIETIKCLKAGDKAYEATAYFLPTGALFSYAEALKMAASRGVDVRILTNSIWTTDMPGVNKAAAVLVYRDLLKAGVRIFERTGDRTMHQKVAVYGSCLGMVGSYNLDNRSASLNSEDVALIYDAHTIQEIEHMLSEDMAENVAVEKTFADYEASEPIEELERSIWAMGSDLM